MTRDDVISRIRALGSQSIVVSEKGLVEDGLALVSMLDERALSFLNEGWIRQKDDPVSIEFFWSNSFKMGNPGQKITIIRTLGQGQFSVELRPSSVRFDPTKWQLKDDGEPLIGIFELSRQGAQALLDDLMNWEFGIEKSNCE